MEQSPVYNFKCVLIGDGGVGKTTLVNLLRTGVMTEQHFPTFKVEVHQLVFWSNYGRIQFNVHDTTGQEKFGKVADDYYEHAHCAIIMFDLTSCATYKNVPKWHRDLVRIYNNLPTIVVGNKCDIIKERKVKEKMIVFPQSKNLPYVEMSAKTTFHHIVPFLTLARQLIGDDALEFIDKVQRPLSDVCGSTMQVDEDDE